MDGDRENDSLVVVVLVVKLVRVRIVTMQQLRSYLV